MGLNAEEALGQLPRGLRAELLEEFAKITRNYRENRWEATELDGGRFCEVVYSILKGRGDGEYPEAAFKPKDFPASCRALEQTPKDAQPQSVRAGLPRVLIGLYEVRNNRGVGHVGGEVNPNHMDATMVLHSVQWVMAELVRIYHDTDTASAQATVDALVDRTLPTLWKVGDVTKVLDTALPLIDQTLLLLYAEPSVSDRTLVANLEQDRIDNYRRVLARLHASRLIEYNRAAGQATISPLGVRNVEERILRSGI